MTQEDKLERLRSLRQKIEKLNRGRLKVVSAASLPGPVGSGAAPAVQARAVAPRPAMVFSRATPRVLTRAAPSVPALGSRVALEHAVDGWECRDLADGPFFLVEHDVAGLDPQVAGLPEQLGRALSALAADGGGTPATGGWAGHACFLDLETTGLSTSPVFLIGLLLVQDGGLVCRQLFARTYAEERSILRYYAGLARGLSTVVTFNGKTFDVPYLRARGAATGVALPDFAWHLDLLHLARRRYRGRLPDCRLQTLEQHVCRRLRGSDVPGSEIPQVYHDFVRTGDARRIAGVLRHNLHDLVTLAELVVRLVATEGTPDAEGVEPGGVMSAAGSGRGEDGAAARAAPPPACP